MARVEATGDSRRKANWEARYQAIIDTSATVFARGGYHATGITELCVANDLGKGALYHYIGSKEDLLAAIHDRVMDEVMLGADRVAEAGGSPSRQLALLGEELLDSCTSSRRSPESGPNSSASGAVPTSSGSRPSCRPASTRASSVPWSPG
jgi:AcrR family transcriptional regulator